MTRTRSAAERAADALTRVEALDSRGPALGAVPVRNPGFAAEVGTPGPLTGRVFTVKDSFAVAGLPLTAGSPAFEGLVASADATVVAAVRRAGAALLGKTNMPPVAIGGGQPGLYGATTSPFNPDFLAAAWHSGSSIGSAVSVAAGYCDLGLGEETVSSGRSPVSNNALVAYTPSWGVVSSHGNLPLHPYRDVVTPHVTSVTALREVLASIAGVDEHDVWHRQRGVDMAEALRVIDRLRTEAEAIDLAGTRIGVPHLYVGERAGDVEGIPIRPSIRALWERTERLLRAAGAETVRVRLPIVESYEGRSAHLRGFEERGFLTPGWTEFELGPLMTHSWAAFLRDFAGGAALSDIDPAAVRPVRPASTDALLEFGHPGRDAFDFARIVGSAPLTEREVLHVAEPALRGLNEARRRLLEDWMDELGLDALAFPANGDIGPAGADTDLAAAELAWRDGAVFSHGNHVIRRVGIPTLTLPMGLTADIGMPVGITLAGRAWQDDSLLGLASAVESLLPTRPVPRLPDVGAAPLVYADPIRAGAEGRRQAAGAASTRNDMEGSER